MSIVLESSTSSGGRERIERPGFIPAMPYMSIFDPPEPIAGVHTEDRRSPVDRVVGGGRGRRLDDDFDSSSSSSIGRNSDLSEKSSEADDSDENEVQSSYKSPLETMDSLEDVLPMKRGISNFYTGKSKSFTSLADVSSISSIKELAKPENAYNRKRKNLLASGGYWDKNFCMPSRNTGSGLSKKPAKFIQNSRALAMAASSGESSNSSGSPNSNACSPSSLPPLPHAKASVKGDSILPRRRIFSSCRSFSLYDLQCVVSPDQGASGSANSSGRKEIDGID